MTEPIPRQLSIFYKKKKCNVKIGRYYPRPRRIPRPRYVLGGRAFATAVRATRCAHRFRRPNDPFPVLIELSTRHVNYLISYFVHTHIYIYNVQADIYVNDVTYFRTISQAVFAVSTVYFIRKRIINNNAEFCDPKATKLPRHSSI